MHHDELRRIQRVKVCCRVDVRDRLGVWNAVTEDVCARGCCLVTTRSPRVGSVLRLTVSSDLFSDTLELTGSVAWVSDRRVGVMFDPVAARRGALAPGEWVARVVEHGKVYGPEPVGSQGPRLVPAVRRPASPRPTARPSPVAARDAAEPEDGRVLPLQHG